MESIMETIKVKTHVGNDGILKLELPIGISNSDLEVVVIIAQSIEDSPTEYDRAEWIAFVERTAGSLADNPIERLPQGEHEVRDELL